MLTLVTSNSAKYAPFGSELERMRIALEPPPQPLPEIQASDFEAAVAAKAKAAAAVFGRPVLVDDAGLVLEAYEAFPGPLTAAVLSRIGRAGLARLLSGVSNRGAMECHIGCWVNGSLRRWFGSAPGRLDLSCLTPDAEGRQTAQLASQPMLLSELFVPDDVGKPGRLLHRARALAALERDILGLHLELERQRPGKDSFLPGEQSAGTCFSCPFCAEFEEDGLSTFASLMGQRLNSRVIYEDEQFVVMPPLGEFIEGGLLLLSRAHILSFAHLPAEHFARLERLVGVICQALSQRWGVSPLIFEHGPAPERSKGACCVDHAHFNIFPAQVFVHPHLSGRMQSPVVSLSELQRLRGAEFGYLFVQENNGERRVYDGCNVPTQLVRRIITTELGMPERWHWRDYLGQDELMATFEALKGQIRV
jgi:diadenosine tetraphosphate (Ap4A) HIT family hydrolase